MCEELSDRVVSLVREVIEAIGLSLEPRAETNADGLRITLEGEGGEVLLRRKGEVLDALQHLVNAAFRPELRDRGHVVIDHLNFRRDRDTELRQTALLLAERAKRTGESQEIGPLNAYARRIVHLAVADDPAVSSESIGDALLKTVIISASATPR